MHLKMETGLCSLLLLLLLLELVLVKIVVNVMKVVVVVVTCGGSDVTLTFPKVSEACSVCVNSFFLFLLVIFGCACSCVLCVCAKHVCITRPVTGTHITYNININTSHITLIVFID